MHITVRTNDIVYFVEYVGINIFNKIKLWGRSGSDYLLRVTHGNPIETSRKNELDRVGRYENL